MNAILIISTFLLGIIPAHAQYMPDGELFPYLPLVHTIFFWGLPAIGALTLLRFLINFAIVLHKSKEGGEDFERAKFRMRFSFVMSFVLFGFWGLLFFLGYISGIA